MRRTVIVGVLLLACCARPGESRHPFPSDCHALDEAIAIPLQDLVEQGWRSLPRPFESLAGRECLFVAERPPVLSDGTVLNDRGGKLWIVRLDFRVKSLESNPTLLQFLTAGIDLEDGPRKLDPWVSRESLFSGDARVRYGCSGTSRDIEGVESEVEAIALMVTSGDRTYVIRAQYWKSPSMPTRELPVVDTVVEVENITGPWAMIR